MTLTYAGGVSVSRKPIRGCPQAMSELQRILGKEGTLELAARANHVRAQVRTNQPESRCADALRRAMRDRLKRPAVR